MINLNNVAKEVKIIHPLRGKRNFLLKTQGSFLYIYIKEKIKVVSAMSTFTQGKSEISSNVKIYAAFNWTLIPAKLLPLINNGNKVLQPWMIKVAMMCYQVNV